MFHVTRVRPVQLHEVHMDKQLETLPDFCGRHSISRTAAYREIGEGRLRITKVGRRTLIALPDAEAWLECVRDKSSAATHAVAGQ